MLEGLFLTPAVTAINEALASAHADGPIAVLGNAKLAQALAGKREVIPVGLPARAAKKLPNAIPDLSSIEAGSLVAVIGVDLATEASAETWSATLRDLQRLVRDGGAIVLVDRGHAPEASRRALCAGLTEIEQRHAGRSVITSGLVTHL
ncbi:MAG: hypothetical protein WKG01_36060 [Kofleriaceae bacterium]